MEGKDTRFLLSVFSSAVCECTRLNSASLGRDEMLVKMLNKASQNRLLRISWRSFSSSSRVIDMAAKAGELRVFMVSGEVSGDTIASHLMTSLKRISPFPVRFAGVGGDLMRKEGLQSLFPMEDITVMGIWELLPHLNRIRRKLNETTEAAISFQPHVVVSVDSKGFSFRFLRQLRARCDQQGLSSPVHTHYVAPSFWAWKGGESRLKGLLGFVDHFLCILPFEEEVLRSNGLAATFVGHPLLEDALTMNLESQGRSNKWKVQGDGEGFRSTYGIPSGQTVITLLPGSRLQEVTRMLPIFLDTMELLKPSFPQMTAVVPVAPNRDVENYIDKAIQTMTVPTIQISGVSQNLKYDAFSASQAALSTSGTAVMELQLARLPCVVAYRAHLLTEWFIRYKTKLRYISLPNILLDSSIVPEALFRACTPNNLASQLSQVINDVPSREEQIVAAEKVFEMLCPPERSICTLTSQEIEPTFNSYSPSMTAACIILYSAKRLC